MLCLHSKRGLRLERHPHLAVLQRSQFLQDGTVHNRRLRYMGRIQTWACSQARLPEKTGGACFQSSLPVVVNDYCLWVSAALM